MRRSVPSGPRGVLEVDWPFFGEICRALALKVARDYQPEIVLGVAKAGVIPGVVVASILQSEFSSMTVTRRPSCLTVKPALRDCSKRSSKVICFGRSRRKNMPLALL